jgi:hypothetical protein
VTIALLIAVAAIVDRTARASAWQEIAMERRWNHEARWNDGSTEPDRDRQQPAAHDAARGRLP